MPSLSEDGFINEENKVVREEEVSLELLNATSYRLVTFPFHCTFLLNHINTIYVFLANQTKYKNHSLLLSFRLIPSVVAAVVLKM